MARRAPRFGWWEARSLREKRLLLFAAALLAAVLVWFLVIRPLMDAQATASARLDAAVTDLANARAEAASPKQQAATATGAPVPQPIGPFVTQSAVEQGFTNAVVTAPEPARASVSIPQAKAPALFAWIGQLEARGLVIESLEVSASANQSVSILLTLRAGGS